MSLESTYQKSLTHIVRPRANGHYIVISGETMYDVILKVNTRSCNCQCGHMSSAVCSHVLAAARLAASQKGYEVVGVRRGDKPTEAHFRLNFNTFLMVKTI